MKTNINYVYICAIASLFLIGVVWLVMQTNKSSLPFVKDSEFHKTNIPAFYAPSSAYVKPKHRMIMHFPFTPDEEALMKMRAERIERDPASDWRTPINFFGLVLDENNQPLEGVHIEWVTTTVSGNGRGYASTSSAGTFFIRTVGKGIDVTATKDGYRSIERMQSFECANFTQEDYYDHDQSNPVVFHLRKIAKSEPIYLFWKTSDENLVGDKITINPLTGSLSHKVENEGIWFQLQPGSENSTNREQYNLILGTALGGGIVMQPKDADLIAPLDGYQNNFNTLIVVDYDKKKNVEGKAFFKDSYGHYGWIDLNIGVGGHQPSIEYTIRYNPSGGRVLSANRGSEFIINKK